MWDKGYSLAQVSDTFDVDVRLVHAALLDLGVLELPRSTNAVYGSPGPDVERRVEKEFTIREQDDILRIATEPTLAELRAMEALSKLTVIDTGKPKAHLPFARSLDHVAPKKGRVPMSARQREMDKLAGGKDARAVRQEMKASGIMGARPARRVGRYWN
jgi:hypothetical protein